MRQLFRGVNYFCRIWAGNPARFIRKQFDDEVVAARMEIKWSEFDDEALRKKAELFNDVKGSIKRELGK